MTKKRKRDRTDTISEQQRIMAASYDKIKPPAHLKMQEADIQFFDAIIAEQANAEWTPHTVTLAAMLAIEMANMLNEQMLLRREGTIFKTVKGYPVVNPRKGMIQLHIGNILALRRSLSIHARAQGVNAADIGRRRSGAKAIQDLMLELEDDDLIARPDRN